MIGRRLSPGAMTISPFMLSIMASGCSGGSATNPPALEQSAVSASKQGDAGSALQPKTAPASALSFGEAVALAIPPWSECTIAPEQDVPGRTESDLVPVGADGELRFYPPSAEWGSRLQIDCKTERSAIHRVVDLNDASTFIRKSQTELAARRIGVQRPLTPDELRLSAGELLQRGYPPPPDRAAAPEAFAEWAKHVTTSVDLFAPIPVARLGAKGGSYKGWVSGAWDAFVQSGGFLSSGFSDGSVSYSTYTAIIQVPPLGACNNMLYCDTVVWTGIGGYPTTIYGVSGDVIQSGFDISNTFFNSHGFVGVWLFVEYTPFNVQDITPPNGYTYGAGDQIRVWGWSSGDSRCQTATTTGAYACFSFIDYTQNWQFAATTIQKPSGAVFVPSTVEYAAERVQGNQARYNANYIYSAISSAGAYDSSFNAHLDPATGSDPYVWVTTGTGATYGGLSAAVFANGTVDTPSDPMYFIWNKY